MTVKSVIFALNSQVIWKVNLFCGCARHLLFCSAVRNIYCILPEFWNTKTTSTVTLEPLTLINTAVQITQITFIDCIFFLMASILLWVSALSCYWSTPPVLLCCYWSLKPSGYFRLASWRTNFEPFLKYCCVNFGQNYLNNFAEWRLVSFRRLYMAHTNWFHTLWQSLGVVLCLHCCI